jgi:hypothetical protein
MGYIGPSPNPGQNREVDDISSSFNGSTTAFTLQVNSQNVSPGSANAIIVSLGGVVQNPGTDYTIAASTLTFTTAPASGLSFFGLVLGQQIDTEGTADGSNNGKFLRANNGAIPSFETVTGTTINNNADNRLISGSGTANTLEGEAGLTFGSAVLSVTGNVVPEANNTRDLGTTSLRWANVYTNDLNLSNEGSSNDIDGTWGSYTIQEGAEDLFLINKRNGKKYKFNLTEVS